MATHDSVCAVILAAGKGTRMKSVLPKVLHPLAGRPVLEWVVKAVQGAGVKDVTLVLSPDLSQFDSFLTKLADVRVAIQVNQNGTGDAVASAACSFQGVKAPAYASGQLKVGTPTACGWTLVVTGDTPAISSDTLKTFIANTKASGKKLAVLGMNVPEPKGYGRILKDRLGGLTQIIEERDADSQTKAVKLCNSGIVMAETKRLFELLGAVVPHNAQNEYYLTDIFSASAKEGETAYVFETDAAFEFSGVNDRSQLSALEEWLLQKRCQELMAAGATLHRPQTIYIEADVQIAQDVAVFPNVSILGASTISTGVQIGAGAVIRDTDIGAGALIGPNCVLTRLSVKAGSQVPPGTIRTEMNF